MFVVELLAHTFVAKHLEGGHSWRPEALTSGFNGNAPDERGDYSFRIVTLSIKR